MLHKVPKDLRKTLTSDPKALTAWKDITPLARNKWICWILSAKKPETRKRKIERARITWTLKAESADLVVGPAAPHRVRGDYRIGFGVERLICPQMP